VYVEQYSFIMWEQSSNFSGFLTLSCSDYRILYKAQYATFSVSRILPSRHFIDCNKAKEALSTLDESDIVTI
jgi:hypothetical protein